MELEQELRLSYYRDVAGISPEHGVYLVQDVRTGKFWVKKVLTVYNAGIYRYLQTHPVAHTPRIVLVEEEDGRLTVIEEYIPGDTLEEIIQEKGILSEKQCAEIAYRLCDILSAFHQCKPPIINRDLKPSNIKITPDGVVKLLDLNAAKWDSSQGSQDTVLLGTRGYAAPEQYGFGPSSALTDVYALGVIMNEMRTGELPGVTLAGGRLRNIITKCVELSPASRYQSTDAVKQALEPLIEKGSSAPARGSWRRYLLPGYRSGGWVNWIAATIGYLFLAAVCTGLIVEDAGPLETLINRIGFSIAIIAIVLFAGNYLDVHRSFILTRSPRRIVRWIGIAVVSFLILMLFALGVNLVVGLLPAETAFHLLYHNIL